MYSLVFRLVGRRNNVVNILFIRTKLPNLGTTLVGDPEHALHNRYGAETACLYLIRPYGYIAYRDQQTNLDSLRRYMKQVFGL